MQLASSAPFNSSPEPVPEDSRLGTCTQEHNLASTVPPRVLGSLPEPVDDEAGEQLGKQEVWSAHDETNGLQVRCARSDCIVTY